MLGNRIDKVPCTVPITDVHALLYSQVLGLGQAFGLFGRQSLVPVALPYVAVL
jgi:hypothetical protein